MDLDSVLMLLLNIFLLYYDIIWYDLSEEAIFNYINICDTQYSNGSDSSCATVCYTLTP